MKILLHICCSNCALYPVRLLRQDGHGMIGLWYNPNIHPLDEYELRLASLRRLSDEWKFDVIYEDEYRPEDHLEMFDISGGPPSDPNCIMSPPARCRLCYGLRLEKTAEQARKIGADAFTTTLLISPYQDQDELIRTGKQLEEKYNIMFYERDFRPYFGEAAKLSKQMGLYRQNYCGCIFSKAEREARRRLRRRKK